MKNINIKKRFLDLSTKDFLTENHIDKLLIYNDKILKKEVKGKNHLYQKEKK